jgi:hypothetical protein
MDTDIIMFPGPSVQPEINYSGDDARIAANKYFVVLTYRFGFCQVTLIGCL